MAKLKKKHVGKFFFLQKFQLRLINLLVEPEFFEDFSNFGDLEILLCALG